VQLDAAAGQAARAGPSKQAEATEEQAERVRRTESRFRGHSAISLFRRSWLPTEPVRAIALVHGFGEHSGRYDHVGAWFARRQTAVHSFDLRGHGRSTGNRGHIDGMSDYLNDLDIFLDRVTNESEGLPVTLIGHSLGGLIVTAFAVERSPRVQSVVTSGAALELSPDLSRTKIMLARLLYKVAPRLGVNTGLDPRAICSDPEVVRRYIDDPLVHGISTTSHAVAMIDQIDRLRGAGARVEVPMFLAHGEADTLCLPRGSMAFYHSLPGSLSGSSGPRAELRMYAGNFHEIFNDLDRETVFADVLDWIQRCEQDAQVGSDRERNDVQ
jgi:alpha-beta hydrolase superfamily lysophospholipase